MLTPYSFLDLDIEVEDVKFKVGIFNKTDHFDFPVVYFPYPDSNKSPKVIFNCFYPQLLDLLLCVQTLVDIMNILTFFLQCWYKDVYQVLKY